MDGDLHILTPMQRRFVEEYIKDSSSATSAAKRAGYSINSATEAASRLLKHPKVIEALEEANNQAVKALGITKERILQELAVVAFSSVKEVVQTGPDGEPYIDIAKLRNDPHANAEVAVNIVTSGRNKGKQISIRGVKSADKVAALAQLGKALGMWKDQVEVTNKHSLLDLIQGSFKEIPQPEPLQLEVQSSEEIPESEMSEREPVSSSV